MDRALNIADLRSLAARRLPRSVFDVIDGGAGDEITMRANRHAFDRVWLRPRALSEGGARDMSTSVLGEPVALPVLLAPCGFARMADHHAELAVARAARRAGTVYAVSTAASFSPDEIAASEHGPLWFQLYLPPSRADAAAMLDRVEAAGYRVLCVTLDAPVHANRERDYRNRLTVPLRLSPRLVLTGISRPRWTRDFLFGRVGDASTIQGVRQAWGNLARVAEEIKAVSTADIRWLRERWSGPLVVKGVLRAEDCPELVDLGVDGVVVSNHGGRQLDGARPTIDVLPEVVDTVDDRAEVFLDSGVRRGTDVLKALALGARACLVGRPYLFGLAAGGEVGVNRALEIFRVEISKAMGLLGCTSLAEVTPDLVHMPLVGPNESMSLAG